MRTIVVPTDFSPTTATALRVAAYLASQTGLHLEALHFHDGYGNENDLVAVKGNMNAQTQAQRDLEEFIRFNTSAGIDDKFGPFTPEVLENLRIRTLIGDPAKGVVEVSKEPQTEMIIMGASGAGVANNGGLLYGSVAQAVSMHGDCPVLLIPQDYKFSDFKNIAYSFRREAPLRAIHHRISFLFARALPRIFYVHLEHDNPDEEKQDTKFLQQPERTDFMEDWAELKLLEPGELVSRLAEVIQQENIDLLIVGRRQRGFIESIFIDSEIRPLLKRCNIPLLIVPIPKH